MPPSQQKLVIKLRMYFWLWICVGGHLNSTRCSITVIQNVSQPNQSTNELNEEENIQITFPIFWFPKRHSESASKVHTTPTETSLNEAKLVERIVNTALSSSAQFLWMPRSANYPECWLMCPHRDTNRWLILHNNLQIKKKPIQMSWVFL